MNIRIFTLGTRGDVQPFVALGMELQRRGHEVTLCTAQNFQAFAEGYGVGFAPIRANFMELTQSAEGKELLGGNPLEMMRSMEKIIYPMLQTMLEDIWSASEGAEALIYHPKAFGGSDVAERLDIPAFAAHPIPIIAPTGLITNPALPIAVKNRWFNKKSYLVNRLALTPFQSMINQWRRESLGLGKRSVFANDLQVNGRDIPVLYGCSPSVVPYDPQWNGNVSMEGFWFLPEPEDFRPTRELSDFLSAGETPIAVSFSSMPFKEPDKIMMMLREALRRVGCRGVIITGWSGMSEVRDEFVYCIPEIPHSWLFPRVSGVIHHGGASGVKNTVNFVEKRLELFPSRNWK